MKIILLTAAILMLSIVAFAQKQTSKDTMNNNKAASGKTQRSKTEPLKVGEVAPDFRLIDQNGKKVTLSEVKNPVVLVFYRGYW